MVKDGANAPQAGDVIENELTGKVETLEGAKVTDQIDNDVTGLEVGTRAYFNAITKGIKVDKAQMVAVVLESRETKGNDFTGADSTFRVKLQYRVTTINPLGEEMKQLRTARLVSQADKVIGSTVIVNLRDFIPVSHSYLMDYVPGMTGAQYINNEEGIVKILATSADFMAMTTVKALVVAGKLSKTETGFVRTFELPAGYEPIN